MKRYVIVMASLFSLIMTQVKAQMPYTVTVLSQVYTPLSGATNIKGTSVWSDTSTFTAPLGFNFAFGNKTTNSFNLLGTNMVGSDLSGVISGFSFIDATLTDRGVTGGTSKSPVRYLTTGAAGKRIFKAELFNAGFSDENNLYSTLNDSLNIQIWLYEDSGIVELHYGPSKISHGSDYFSNGSGPMVGFAKNLDYDKMIFDKVYILTGSTSSPTIDSATASSPSFPTLNTYPPSGTVYRFVPKNKPTKVSDAFTLKGIKVFPTSCTERLFVESQEEAVDYAILSMNGAIVKKGSLVIGANAINVGDIPWGMYLLNLRGSTAFGTYKFIKE